ncbi:MAG: isopenicillin N synthase family oxygenase [Gammaproteobacteria bacterium]|nr:isopenicillin N synthase family oxygenase [Gammaproteobacteria bacterium]
MDFRQIPVIDLEPLSDDSDAGYRQVALLFDKAYRDVGFTYITNHGVPQDVIDAAFDASRRFHALPLIERQKIAINEFHRGYMALATSTIVTSSVEKATRPNLSESFMMMHELADDDPDVLAAKPLAGPNQWPDKVPGFREAVTRYNDTLEQLARRLTRVITVALDIDLQELEPWFAKPTTFLRLLHYPPQPVDAADNQYGSAPHTDYGFITILAQDRNGGLQVQNKAGAWIDALPIDNSFVVNIGDMTARWTNDRWRSTRHRVINRSGGDRYSVPYFFDPHMDVMVECLPTCVSSDNPARYEPVRYGDYLMYRLEANYDYRLG